MGLLIRIQKKLENKLLHRHGEHGKPIHYADPDGEIDEATTRTSTSCPRPSSRLNLSFLSSTRRSSTQPQSCSTDTRPRSPSFFCRGSSSQPEARGSLHARDGSNHSATGPTRRSGTWPGQDAGSGQSFRVPAFPNSGYISRGSDPDIGFLPESDEPLASPSQLGNSMTLGGSEMNNPPRRKPTTRGISGPATDLAGPAGIADHYDAPSAISPNEDFVKGEDYTATATSGLRGFEGDRDGFFTPLVSTERPVQPARTQTTAPAVGGHVIPARTQTATPSGSGDGGRTMRMHIDDARRERRPFTTTRALTGYEYVKGHV